MAFSQYPNAIRLFCSDATASPFIPGLSSAGFTVGVGTGTDGPTDGDVEEDGEVEDDVEDPEATGGRDDALTAPDGAGVVTEEPAGPDPVADVADDPPADVEFVHADSPGTARASTPNAAIDPRTPFDTMV